jgi:hypothetical protein
MVSRPISAVQQFLKESSLQGSLSSSTPSERSQYLFGLLGQTHAV